MWIPTPLVLLPILGLASGASAATAAAPAVLEYVYAESNVGGSSGGHAALKLDDRVYHFQQRPDRIFRLERESWERFRYAYNTLENRTLRAVRLEVARDVYEQIEDRLSRLHLIQKRHLDVLAAIREDDRLLAALLEPGGEARVRGLGLFSQTEAGDPDARRLARAVEERYGPGSLREAALRAEQALRSMRGSVADLGGMRLSWDAYPRPGPIFSEEYLERLTLREALRALADSRALDPEALVDPLRFEASEGGGRLQPGERARLVQIGRDLESAVLELVDSRRPDRGYPLLLAMARHQAVRRSLAANRLLFLDPFPDDAALVDRPVVQADRALLEKLAARARRAYDQARRDVFARRRLGEGAYRLLEERAGVYHELSRGAVGGRAIRLAGDRPIPSRSAAVRLGPAVDPPAGLREQREAAQRNASFYGRALRGLYDYDLIRRNCVTEIFRSLNSAFASQEETTRRLGGQLRPGEALSFIPFVSFQRVTQRFPIRETRVLPSYRQRKLAERYAGANAARVYLRESNTLSSSLYEGSDGDGAFLLFTDDVVWPRPLYGALNLGYGLAHATAGLFTWPADRGERLRSGLLGAFFSLPELFFANIRKGSFAFVDED